MDVFLGTIQLFGFNFAPRGWALCAGQLLAVNQNSALFSLLGTTYGGNGQTTFALPDLRGRAPVGMGQGVGLSPRVIGEVGGTEQVNLTTAQLPAHNHGVSAATDTASKSPVGNLPGLSVAGSAYAPTAAGSMAADMVQFTGNNQPHPNMQPYLVGNWCIAVEGIFPPRD